MKCQKQELKFIVIQTKVYGYIYTRCLRTICKDNKSAMTAYENMLGSKTIGGTINWSTNNS